MSPTYTFPYFQFRLEMKEIQHIRIKLFQIFESPETQWLSVGVGFLTEILNHYPEALG